MPRQLLEDLPFRDLGKATMIALEKAGHEITAIATYSETERRVIGTRYCVNTEALCFLTNRSASSVNYWVSTGKIKPAKKFGNFSLFAIEDVNQLLTTGQFPGAKVEQLYEPATAHWINPPNEVIDEAEADIAAEKQAKAASAAKPKKRA